MSKPILRHLKASVCLGLFATVIFQSCKKADQIAEENYTQEEIAQMRTYVASSTGLNPDQIEYDGANKTFVVSKDGLISAKDAMIRMTNSSEGGSQANREQQRVNVYTISQTNATNIAIYADASVPADWLAALDQSIANWNSTNSRVFLKRVTSSTTTTTTGGNGKGNGKKGGGSTTTTTAPSYNILVTTMYNNATSTIAQAYYPDYYGNAGKQVTINTYYNYLNASYKIFAMTHELGHNLGFTHTDGTYGNIIPGTPVTDPNSVMNSFVLPWSSFTPYDVLAVTTIYPK